MPRYLALILLVLGACERDQQASTPEPDIRAGEVEEVTYDERFVDAMIAYADYTEKLGAVGARRAHDPELKVFAENMATENDAMVDQLKNWRKLWFGDAKPAIRRFDEADQLEGVSPYGFGVAWTGVTVVRDATQPEDVTTVAVTRGVTRWDADSLLKALREAPAEDFDRLYVATLVEHHRWAADAARSAAPRLVRPELKVITTDLADTSASHMLQLDAIRARLPSPAPRPTTG